MRVKCGLHFTRILRLWCFGLDAKMLPCIYYDIGSGNMKWMKFWDTIFVNPGSAWHGSVRQQLLLWCMVVGIRGTGVHRSECAHCGVHAALPILPLVLGYDVFYRRENVLPALRQRCARGQKRLTAPSFSAMLDASNMRKRGYHETGPVSDAGHGIQS